MPGPGPIDVSTVPYPLLLIGFGLIMMVMTVGMVWIVIPYCVAKIIQLVNKIRRGSEDGIY